jgi:hypothetical protein
MAHYALLDSNNVVTNVIVGLDEDVLIEGLDMETYYGNLYNQKCVRTSYNGNIRKRYAGVGMSYDPQRDVFLFEKPVDALGLDETTLEWIMPEVIEDEATTE